jgi:transcriptional regulator with XRE-family HTH domain
MNDWMIFAERLSEQMKKQNLSIRQLAERMDMTPTTIFRYASGQRVPRANEILKASDVLGVTCDYLIGLSDDPKKTSRSTVQQERKTGRWVYAYRAKWDGTRYYFRQCDQCLYERDDCDPEKDTKFCPDCGARLIGGDDNAHD